MQLRQIAKDLLTYLPGKVLPAFAAFVTVPIYTRIFSPDEFGVYALAVAAAEFLLLGTTTGFGQGAVRFFNVYQLRSSLSRYFATVYGSVGLITLVVTVLSAGLLLVCRSLIPPAYYQMFWAALALYVASASNATLMDVLRGQEKSKWYSTIWVCQCYGGIILGLVLVLGFRMNVSGLIWGQTLGLLLSLIPLFWLTTRGVTIDATDFNRSDFRQLWSFAMPFTIGNLAFWSLSLSDRYIVEIFRGSYEVGLYSVAAKVSTRSIQLLVSLFFLVPAPVISRLWEERGRKATEDVLTLYTRIFFLTVIPAVVGLAVVAAPLLRILAGDEYFAGYPAIWFLACASMGLGLADLASSGCLVTNHTRLIARNQCIAAATGLVLNILLVPKMGFIGAALSAAIAFAFLAGLQALTSARFLTWRWPYGSLWRVLAASAAMAASVIMVQLRVPSDMIAWQVSNLILSVTAGVLVYGLCLWGLGEVSPSNLIDLFRTSRTPVTTQVTGEAAQR